MQPQEIISSDLLDILFADRNKLYGAYTLRRNYNRRLLKALLGTAIIVTLALAAYYSFGDAAKQKIADIMGTPVELTQIEQPPPETPVLPPPPPPPAPKVATIKNLIHVIVQDNLADNVPPPTQTELENSRIGNITQAGIDEPYITAPPIEDKGGVIAAPKRPDDDNKIYINVSIESTYPGGLNAWKRFLNKTFTYPSDAQEKDIQGTVVVKFVVDKTGTVSNIQAIAGPDELRNEAIRVISKSGKWKPAIQNGYEVNSYKTQSIVFTLQNE